MSQEVKETEEPKRNIQEIVDEAKKAVSKKKVSKGAVKKSDVTLEAIKELLLDRLPDKEVLSGMAASTREQSVVVLQRVVGILSDKDQNEKVAKSKILIAINLLKQPEKK